MCHTSSDTKYLFLRSSATLTQSCCRVLTVKLLLLAVTTEVCRDQDSNTQPAACKANTLINYRRGD